MSTQRHITEIHLENFQDHRDTVIKLKPGMNLITGSSDAGKSAILRGINFVFHNLPRGKSFIRYGADEARVAVTFSDGTVVQRIKGDRNAYVIVRPNGDVEGYDRIGNEIPPQVQEALGNPPCDDKHGPIAYAEQMSPLFLVSLTSTELPRALSELTGIDDFEEAAQLLAKRARASDRHAKESQARVEGLDRDLEQYFRLDAELEHMHNIEAKFEAIAQQDATLQSAEHMMSRYNDVNSAGLAASTAFKASQRITVFADRVGALRDEASRIASAEKLLNNLQEWSRTIEEAEERCRHAEKLADQKFADRLHALSYGWDNIELAEGMVSGYTKINADGLAIKKQVDEWKAKILLIADKKSALIESMRDQGMWCDSCNRPLAEAI
jgi:DNA repair ATPase RecN